jgi:hypothetical protein
MSYVFLCVCVCVCVCVGGGVGVLTVAGVCLRVCSPIKSSTQRAAILPYSASLAPPNILTLSHKRHNSCYKIKFRLHACTYMHMPTLPGTSTYMHISTCTHTHTHTHTIMCNTFLFHGNIGFAVASQCYVMRTLPVLLILQKLKAELETWNFRFMSHSQKLLAPQPQGTLIPCAICTCIYVWSS